MFVSSGYGLVLVHGRFELFQQSWPRFNVPRECFQFYIGHLDLLNYRGLWVRNLRFVCSMRRRFASLSLIILLAMRTVRFAPFTNSSHFPRLLRTLHHPVNRWRTRRVQLNLQDLLQSVRIVLELFNFRGTVTVLIASMKRVAWAPCVACLRFSFFNFSTAGKLVWSLSAISKSEVPFRSLESVLLTN